MSKAVAVYHGAFGRTALYRLDRGMSTHAHREGHLVFNLDGPPSRIEVNNQTCMPSQGRAVAINPWEPHAFEPGDRDEGALFLTLYVDQAWFREASADPHQPLSFGRSEFDVTRVMSRSVGRITDMLHEGATSDRLDGAIFELTRECFEWSRRGLPDQSAPHRFTDFRLRRSIKLMRENLGGEMELDRIAREAGLSRPHFFRLFRRQTGLTPNLFLNTLRMEKAIDGLTRTETAVADIAFDLGFSSQSSFTRFFASNAGLAPSDYRRVSRRIGS